MAPTDVDPAHPAAGLPDQLFRNGARQVQVTALGEVSAGTFFVDPATKALTMGSDPTGTNVEAAGRANALTFSGAAAGSAVRGITFTRFAPAYINSTGAVVVNTTGVTLENNTFSYASATSVMVFKGQATLRHNTFDHNGARGMGMNLAHDSLVEKNLFTDTNTERFATTNCGGTCSIAALKAAHTDNLTVRGNTFAGTTGAGFWCDLGCTDGVITGNLVEDNTTNGIFYEVSASAIIASNTLVGNTRGIKISGSAHIGVYNNTFYANKQQLAVIDDARSSSTDSYSSGLGQVWDTADVGVFNNAFIEDGSVRQAINTLPAQVGPATFFSGIAGNGYALLATAGTRFVWYTTATVTYATPATFSAATGKEPGAAARTVTTKGPATFTDGYHIVDPGLLALPVRALPASVTAALNGAVPTHVGALDL